MMTMDCSTTAGPVSSKAQHSPSRKKANRRMFIGERYALPATDTRAGG